MHKFYFTVSTEPYNRNKDEGSEKKIEWTEEKGTVEDLINYVKEEYAFCPTFHHNKFTFANSLKTNNNLKASYFICFDIDAVKTEAGDFYDMMMLTEIQPSIVYTTCNNGTFKSDDEEYNNRYRVIYLLDEPITDHKEYRFLHEALKNEVASYTHDDYSNDRRDKSVSHFYAGNAHADVWYNDTVTTLQFLKDRYCYGGSFFGGGVAPTNSPEFIPRAVTNMRGKRAVTHRSGDFSEFLKDYENKSNTFGMLVQKYKHTIDPLPLRTDITPYLNESNEHKLYIDVDENYMEIRLPYNRIKDGHHRKDKIFQYCVKLRQITPDATYEQLLWMALQFLYYHIDNTEDPINRTKLSSIVNDALGKDLSEWKPLMKKCHKTFKLNKTEVSKRDGLSTRDACLKANNERATDKKNEKWEKMLELYNPELKDKENIAILKEHDIEVSPKYYYKFKKANGLTKKKAKQPKPVKYEMPEEIGSVLCESDRRIENNGSGMRPESIFIKSGCRLRQEKTSA